ncbi:MAG: helix-turn-helix domain-containing protein [Rhodobacteraceae bacterium]|nr:helix-turn-helix domain-containing protein [Paracoccaceae bacterium]PHR56222.1 MAG: hypothetical protein COA47_13090 [Robiginitomaculum sp.]
MADKAASKNKVPSVGLSTGRLLRTARRSQNITLQDLSERVNLSVGYLSQIERDIATPSLSSLTRLAAALTLDLGHFMPTAAARGLVSKAKDRETTWVRAGCMTYQRLHGEFPGATFSAYLITLPTGFVGEIDQHIGEEFVEIRSGRAIFEIDGIVHDLGPGDTLHFRSDMRHQARNPTDDETLLFWLGNGPALRQRPDMEARRIDD